MARAMVTQFGMSDILGPRAYGTNNGSIFLGRELGEQRDYSEHYAEEIDNEVKRILQGNYDRAKQILLDARAKMDLLAGVLIEQETLDRAAFEELMMSETPGVGPGKPSEAPLPTRFETDYDSTAD
jgi:cell division protease FtsH